jgi:hypothetical protein
VKRFGSNPAGNVKLLEIVGKTDINVKVPFVKWSFISVHSFERAY